MRRIFGVVGLGLCSFLNSASAFTLISSNAALEGWSTRSLTIRYNATNCGVSEAVLTGWIDEAVAMWNSVGSSSMKLSRGEATTLGVTEINAIEAAGSSVSTAQAALWAQLQSEGPVVFCDSAFSSSPDVVQGLGSPWSTGNSIIAGYIRLNSKAGAAAQITDSTTGGVLIAHEIGHVLGFGHSGDNFALMFGSYQTGRSNLLAQDDIDALSFLYPRSELSSGFFGCATVAAGGSAGKASSSGERTNSILPWAALALFFGLARAATQIAARTRLAT